MKREELECMRDVWTKVYAAKRKTTIDNANVAFDREASFFETQSMGNQELAQCTIESQKNTFLNIAVNGLSIQEGSKAEASLTFRNASWRDQNGKDVWYKVMNLLISPYGELNMRIMAKQILRASNPIVIYDCDYFQPRTNEMGDLIVDYRPQIPRPQGARIIGCYIQLFLPNGGRDYKWLLEDDIARLAGYSIRNSRKGSANALYSSNNGQIDPGFLEAKTIKHALRAFTKMEIGDGIMMSGEEEVVDNDSFDNQEDTNDDTMSYNAGENEEETF